MTILLLRLAGPMQSWGVSSRFGSRDTAREPSKSGVIGLLCAAAGIPRHDTDRLRGLAALEMAVRVDREGTVGRDFQTVGGGSWPGRQEYGVYRAAGKLAGTAVSERFYLAGADFLVGFAGSRSTLEPLQEALRRPVWPLCLGRKSYVPGRPVWLRDGLREGELLEVLKAYPWEQDDGVDRLRLVRECGPSEGVPRHDVPLSFELRNRKFGVRHVRMDWLDAAELPAREG